MIERFPKLDSPLVREERDGGYYVTDEVQEGHEWVFDEAEADHTYAAEKLDGTNCAVRYTGDDLKIWTRMGKQPMNEARWLSKDRGMVVDGALRAWRKGWIERFGEQGEPLYGELIGEKVQGNPYDIDGHLFVPFQYLRWECAYETYGKYDVGKEAFRQWFDAGLIPLFYAQWHNVSFDEAQEKCQPEGVVFWSRETGDMSKLRYDMFDLDEG